LAHDVLGRKDRLEVEPDGLALEPLVDRLLKKGAQKSIVGVKAYKRNRRIEVKEVD